jgi:hypothetical protein
VISQMHQDDATQAPTDYFFLNQTPAPTDLPQDFSTFAQQQVVAPGTNDVHPAAQPTVEEEALAEKIAERQHLQEVHSNPHMRTLQPLHTKDGQLAPAAAKPLQPAQAMAPASAKPQTSPPKPVILELANNNDLNVATIARQAERLSESNDEVVISLH